MALPDDVLLRIVRFEAGAYLLADKATRSRLLEAAVRHNGRCLRFVPLERLADLGPAAARRDAEAIAELRGHLSSRLLQDLAQELLRENATAELPPLRTRAAVLLHEVSGGLWERPLQPLRGSAGEFYRRAFRTAVHEGDAALVRHVLRQRPGFFRHAGRFRSELPAALAVASCAPRGGAIALRHCGKALTRDPALWAEAVRTSGAEALLTPAAQAAPRAAFEASRAALGCLCLALLRLDRSDALEVLQRGGPCSCGRRGSKSCFDGDEELALAALASGHRMEDFFWDTLGDDFWEAHGARWSAVKWPEVQESDAFRRYALRSFLSDIAIVRSVVSPLLLGQLFRRTPIDRREAMRAEYMENPLLHALRLVVQNQKLIVSVSAGLNGVFVPLQRMTGVSTSIGSLVGLNSTLRHFLRQWTEYVGKDDVVEWIASEMGYHRADSMLAHLGEYPF